jgi:transcriptional regulator
LSLHDNRKHGDDLVEAFEKRLLPKTPWDLKTMEPTKRETMLRSIVVLEMEIERIEGQRKLNQHKSDKDHVSVARHLVATGEPAAIAIAEKMRGFRISIIRRMEKLKRPHRRSRWKYDDST